MEDFLKLINPDLESVIVVRNKENQVKSKLPEKVKLECAINGQDNLIKLAFDSKLIDNFIKKDFLSTLSNRNEDDQDLQVDKNSKSHSSTH